MCISIINKMKKGKIEKIIFLALAVLISVGFFLGVSGFVRDSISDGIVKWGAPDENANYVFTKLYAQSGELRIYEKYNLHADCVMHPRSFRCDGAKLKPMSFLGMILIYGKIASLTSYKIIPYLTVIFAAIGLFFYYLFIKKLFNRSVALISTLLLSVFPVYIYYSVRSMFHNILFIVLLLIGLYFGILMVGAKSKKFVRKNKERKKRKAWEWLGRVKSKMAKVAWFWYKEKELPDDKKKVGANKPSLLSSIRSLDIRKVGLIDFGRVTSIGRGGFVYSALSGLFVGLAVITRTSELLWILPMLVVLWAFNFWRIGIIKLAIFISFFALALLPVLHYNSFLYGSPYYGGYAEMNKSLDTIKGASAHIIELTSHGAIERSKGFWHLIKDNIFYFGFNPRQSLKMLNYYFVEMFPYIFWPALFGFFLFIPHLATRGRKKHLAYISALVTISAILVIYYGSWRFFDNPDATRHTIGNSYTRYWLPIYMGAIPFVAYAIVKITSFLKLAKRKKSKISGWIASLLNWKVFTWILRIAVIAPIMAVSVQYVLTGSEEGLIATADRAKDVKVEFSRVIEITENNSVIITQYHDKLFFPERKVIYGLFNDKAMVARYAVVAKYLPLYYYNFSFSEKDLEYLNNRRLYEAGLHIEKIEEVTDGFTLYKLTLN